MEQKHISFDVVIKRNEDVQGNPPTNNPEAIKPSPEIIEKCRRFLADQGITCKVTEFGLSCSATKPAIESVFATEIAEIPAIASANKWEFIREPVIPDTMKAHVRQISFPPTS